MKKIIALLGSTLLITGCFLPIMNIGIETFNLFDWVPMNATDVPKYALIVPGCVIIAIAIATAIFALINKTKLLWIAGIIESAIAGAVFAGIHFKIAQMKDEMDNLMGGIFRQITETLFQPVQLGGSGWYLLGSGALLIILSSLLKIKKLDTINTQLTN